jgi:hypothetical protein
MLLLLWLRRAFCASLRNTITAAVAVDIDLDSNCLLLANFCFEDTDLDTILQVKECSNKVEERSK